MLLEHVRPSHAHGAHTRAIKERYQFSSDSQTMQTCNWYSSVFVETMRWQKLVRHYFSNAAFCDSS